MTSDTPGAKFIAYYNNVGASLQVSQDGVNWTHYSNPYESDSFSEIHLDPYLLDFPIYIKEDQSISGNMEPSAYYAAIVFNTSDPDDSGEFHYGSIKFEGKLKYLLTTNSKEIIEIESHCDPYIGYKINGYDPEQSIVIEHSRYYDFIANYIEE